jgi:hypothetical protein
MTSDLQTKSEISKFFNDYTKLFDARDGTGISAYYHAPSISVRADASIHVYRSHQEARDFFQAVADRYYDEGQRGSRCIDLEVKCLGVKSVLATLEWQMLATDGSIIRKWNQSYNLIQSQDRWQILVSTIHI